MILPVFSLYANELEGVTPTLLGIAIGVYGLTQALLQIPFGRLSDRIGRKPVIAGGLVLFAIGSVVAALATSIEGVIIGRALQGSGAIASAIMALTADLTSEEHRTKAMAMIGMSIGASFALSMILGPIVHSLVGGAGIFWLTAVLASLALLILFWRVPTPVHSHVHSDAEVVTGHLKQVLSNTQLLRLDAGILVLHLVLTASFVVMPLMLRDIAGLRVEQHAMVYFPVFLASAIIMVPFIIIAEKYRRMKQVFLFSIGMLIVAEFGLSEWAGSLWLIIAWLVLFFASFNILEASLPSMIAKLAPADKKGTAMGVYSSSQFVGAFLGGVSGGWVYGHFGQTAVFAMAAGIVGLWWLWAVSMAPLPYLSSRMLHVGEVNTETAQRISGRLLGLAGVAEVTVVPDEQVAFLKVDSRQLDEVQMNSTLTELGLNQA